MGGEGGRGNCDNQRTLFEFEDVLIEILLCLPVISLLRFKSVCKSWRSIIETPFFINLHATTTTTKSGGIGAFCKQRDKHEEEEKTGNEHQAKEKICRLSGDEFKVFEDLGRPPLIDFGEKEIETLKRTHWGRANFNVVGCSNGIICLHESNTRNFVLWNPAIKQSRRLPKPSNLLGNPNRKNDYYSCYIAEDVVAFGVDAKTKDNKVLLITTLEPKETYYDQIHHTRSHSPRPRRVHVYSLSTDSWRCIDITLSDAHPYLKIDRSVTQGVYLNGSHYFAVQEYFCTRPLILSLDLTEEIFKTIQPPPYDEKLGGTGWNYLIPLGEKLALVKGFPFQCEECNVWVLNEQQHSGVKESWTKLYPLGYPNFKSPIGGLGGLQCIANNGQFATIYWKGYVRVMNLITGELKSDGQGQLLLDCGVGIYRPSLVQISRSTSWCNNK